MLGQGVVDYFLGKLVRHGYLHEMNPELDEIRSEYPTVGSNMLGIYSGAAGVSAALDSFAGMSIPSGHVFHLRYVHAMVRSDASLQGIIYDGPGTSVPKYFVYLNFSGAQAKTDIMGAVFQSIPCFSIIGTQSNVLIKIGGLIRERSPSE